MKHFDEFKGNFVDNKLVELFQAYWKDEYVTNLSIVDHCREVVQLWDKDKLTKQHMSDFEKEVTDLFILICFKNMVSSDTNVVDFDFDLILDRLEKFQSKLRQKNF